jgi:tRNA (mo5U34)-methyltransferase
MSIREYLTLLRNRGRLIRSVRHASKAERYRLSEAVKSLGPWFHNYEIASGIWTNGDGEGPGLHYPAARWGSVASLLPAVSGKHCLDVGCSSGFFSIKLKELGAAYVLGIDDGEQQRAIEQARFAAAELGLDIAFEKRSVYDLRSIPKQFDIVLFMGVFYHLRHPLLALENLRAVCRDTLILQTICTPRPPGDLAEIPADKVANLDSRSQILSDPRFPTLRFIEHCIGPDSTCWWVPNPEGVCAMLRSSGFRIDEIIFPSENDMFVKCSVGF